MYKKYNIPKLTNAPYVNTSYDRQTNHKLWEETLVDVSPLKHPKRILPPSPKTTHHINEPPQPSFNDVTYRTKRQEPKNSTQIEKSLKRRIAKGKEPIDATLDLHGMRLVEAHQSFLHFIKRITNSSFRTALIITGKGKDGEGVIRRSFPNWLDSPAIADRIQSYSLASPEHGGTGAFYIRLCK